MIFSVPILHCSLPRQGLSSRVADIPAANDMSTTNLNDLLLGGDGAAHLRAASDHWQGGRFDLAISSLTNIHGDGFTAACVSFTVAIATLKLGRHAEAFALLREAVEALAQLDREPASLVRLQIDD